MICMKCRMKKKFHISHWHIKALTPFIPLSYIHGYECAREEWQTWGTTEEKKSLTEICFYRFYFPLLGMPSYTGILLMPLTFFLICNAHSNDDKKGNRKKRWFWERMKKEKWNEIKFLRCGVEKYTFFTS